jgi:hypothetical protein
MVDYIIPEYNITLIDFNKVFIKEIQINILDDLYKYKLLDKSLNNKDVQKIFYHHIIHVICEDLLKSSSGKPIILFNYTQLDDCVIKEYYKEDKLLEFLSHVIQKIERNLPIKIFKTKLNVQTVVHLKEKNDGRALTLLTKLIEKSNTFNVNDYSFEKIKRLTKKYELTFLNIDYFNRIKTKQILIK